ncbi:MAG: hypothetical protein HRU09_19090 [Oligoflexales bacterium]|nr:hypothetical protein [Oligoflexales bacterium]
MTMKLQISFFVMFFCLSCLDANTLVFDGEFAEPADASNINQTSAATYTLNTLEGGSGITGTVSVSSAGMQVSVSLSETPTSGVSVVLSDESYSDLSTNGSFAKDPLEAESGTTYTFTLPKNRILSEYSVVFHNSGTVLAVATRTPVSTSGMIPIMEGLTMGVQMMAMAMTIQQDLEVKKVP